MLAWYSDISNLIEKTGDERNAFVRRHTRSISAGSARSVSSDGGLEEDEADQIPFSTQQSVLSQPMQEAEPTANRPSPGGRFPSDIQVNRGLQAPVGPSSGSSSEVGNDLTTASGGFQGTFPSYQTDSNQYDQYDQNQQHQQPMPSQAYSQDAYGHNANNAYQQPAPVPAPVPVQQQDSYYAKNPPANPAQNEYAQQTQPQQAHPTEQSFVRHDSTYGNWMAPAAGGAALGALGAGAYAHHQQDPEMQNRQQPQPYLNDSTQTQSGFDPNLTAQPVPDRHPDHTASLINPVVAPIPLTSEREPDSLATTPSAAHQPFLGEPEAILPAVASEKAINGRAPNPGMKRQNTDFSVSDLHVPGEYPKTPGV
jgi:hypothetical protein